MGQAHLARAIRQVPGLATNWVGLILWVVAAAAALSQMTPFAGSVCDG